MILFLLAAGEPMSFVATGESILAAGEPTIYIASGELSSIKGDFCSGKSLVSVSSVFDSSLVFNLSSSEIFYRIKCLIFSLTFSFSASYFL